MLGLILLFWFPNCGYSIPSCQYSNLLVIVSRTQQWGHLQACKMWYGTGHVPLYDTTFYKPEDDPKWLKHVALLIVA